MSKYRAVEVKIAGAGALMADVSPDVAHIGNWRVKRDWRRELDQEVRSEGYDRFLPDPAYAVDQYRPGTTEAITLITQVRGPSGRLATIVGDKTRLWRYLSYAATGYVEDDYWPEDYLETNTSGWQLLGSGFSPNGKRWEAVEIAGTLILNNGVDLPVSLREDENELVPLWELRELGIASVGTIAEANGMLVCADLKQIKAEAHAALMSPRRPLQRIFYKGLYNGLAKVTIPVTAGREYYYQPGAREKRLVNGTETIIDAGYFTAEGSSVVLEGLLADAYATAEITTTAAGQQLGVNCLGFGTLNNGNALEPGNLLMAETPGTFNEGMVGWTVRMANGAERTIAAFGDSWGVTLDGAPTLAEPAMPMYLLDPAMDHLVNSFVAIDPALNPSGELLPVFTAEDVGEYIVWESGEVHKITEFIDGLAVRVDNDLPVAFGPFHITNYQAYRRVEDEAILDRYPWRLMNSLPGQPRRFGAVWQTDIRADSNVVQFAWPIRSLVSGRQVLIISAGMNGSNLLTTVGFVDRVGWRALLTDATIATAAASIAQALQHSQAAEQSALRLRDSTKATLEAAQAALETAKAAKEALPTNSTAEEKRQADAAIREAGKAVDEAQAEADRRANEYAAAQVTLETLQAYTQPTTTLVASADAAPGATVAGYTDLEDDGSPILKMLALRNILVIYRETSIFHAEYTAAVGSPWKVTKAYPWRNNPDEPTISLYYRHTLVAVGSKHLFAGRDGFYLYDVINRVPAEVGTFEASKRLFFGKLRKDPLLGSELTLGRMIPAGEYPGYVEVTGPLGTWYQLKTPNTGDPTQFYYTREQLTVSRPVLQVFNANAAPDGNGNVIVDRGCREILGDADPVEQVFAAVNSITREAFVFFPSAGEDKCLRYDLRQGTLATSTLDMTAAGMVIRPLSASRLNRSEPWFVMGDAAGSIFRYGLVDQPEIESGLAGANKSAGENQLFADPGMFTGDHVGGSIVLADGRVYAITGFTSRNQVTVLGDSAAVIDQTFTIVPAIWHRDGQAYNSVLESGREHFGAVNLEKIVNQYTPIVDSRLPNGQANPGLSLAVSILGGENPRISRVLAQATVASPATNNMVPMIAAAHYLGDKLVVSGTNNPCGVISRIFNVYGLGSQGFARVKGAS
jgi:hypothetical protein